MATGGAIGTLLRFFLVSSITEKTTSLFPWGTFTVNLIGSFTIGILAAISMTGNFNSNTKAFLFVGLLGGFTTFSSLALEGLQLFRNNQSSLAISYIFSSNVLGLLLAFIGFRIGSLFN